MADRQDDFQSELEALIDLEMDDIERELAAHPEVSSLEADDKIKERIDAVIAEANYEKIISQLPEEYKDDIRKGRGARKEAEGKTKRRIYSYCKKLGAAAAVVLLVVGMGATSEGGPKRVIEFVQGKVGEREIDSATSVNNEEVLTVESVDEAEAYQMIKEEIGIIAVRVVPLGDTMYFKSIEIDPQVQTAYLIYDHEGRNVSYGVQGLYTDCAWASDVEDELVGEYPYELKKSVATIKEYRIPETELKKYVARFEYQGVDYQLAGTMEWADFEFLLKNLHFL